MFISKAAALTGSRPQLLGPRDSAVVTCLPTKPIHEIVQVRDCVKVCSRLKRMVSRLGQRLALAVILWSLLAGPCRCFFCRLCDPLHCSGCLYWYPVFLGHMPFSVRPGVDQRRVQLLSWLAPNPKYTLCSIFCDKPVRSSIWPTRRHTGCWYRAAISSFLDWSLQLLLFFFTVLATELVGFPPFQPFSATVDILINPIRPKRRIFIWYLH